MVEQAALVLNYHLLVDVYHFDASVVLFAKLLKLSKRT